LEAYTGDATLPCFVGRRFLLGLAVVLACVAPGQARAAIPLAACSSTSEGALCGTVTVPIDRTGVFPGTIGLHVEVLPPSGLPRGTMFLIAGGPGQGSAGAFDLGPGFTRELMQFMFPGYTLVAFDNRGTGQSGVLRCPGLQAVTVATAEQEAAHARDCADQIGPARVFYATRDHAEDTEAVRRALGLGRIGLYGVSYGTKLAMAYALAHPEGVERLLLDSVVVPTFPDPFDRNVLHEMPRTLTSFCAGGVCSAATGNFGANVVKLANRLEARPIKGKVIMASGKVRTLRMTGEDLISLIVDVDLSPGLTAEAPAAVHAALAGNIRPLLRLFDLDLGSNEFAPEDLSFGLYAATNCSDAGLPWPADTPPAARQAIMDAAVAGLPPGSLGGFGNWAARIGRAYFCEQWPAPAGGATLAPGPLPDVPVLALNGGLDLRTPTVNALDVVSDFPQGRLIEVPGVGHSVTGADASFCSQNAVRRWMTGTLVAPNRYACPRVLPIVKVLGTFSPAPSKASVKSTLAVVAKTLREAEASWWQLPADASTMRGLFGGKLVRLPNNGDGFTLAKYVLTPGVFISGKIEFAELGPPSTYKGTIKVSGPRAVAGTLTISKNSVSGRLGGRSVKANY
jgi:pimeloyl-ACP methyl ester carboxylesterase